jgi:two-component system OmpR family response regulator
LSPNVAERAPDTFCDNFHFANVSKTVTCYLYRQDVPKIPGDFVMGETSPHILVVDDHRDIRETLARYLVKNGLRASSADSAAQARKMLTSSAVDLVVLDVMMPGEDGLSLCRHLVESGGAPVILLTAMAEDTDRVVGLEIGADDYVTKPFNPRELLARIRAVLRRTSLAPKERDPISSETLTFSGWTLDLSRQHLIGQDDVIIPLSTGEFQLLVAFLKRPKIVLSRDQLLDLTSGRTPNMFDRSIDNQVSRLRRKVEKNAKQPELIKTVWGGGYKFTADVVDPDR